MVLILKSILHFNYIKTATTTIKTTPTTTTLQKTTTTTNLKTTSTTTTTEKSTIKTTTKAEKPDHRGIVTGKPEKGTKPEQKPTAFYSTIEATTKKFYEDTNIISEKPNNTIPTKTNVSNAHSKKLRFAIDINRSMPLNFIQQ